MHFLWPQCYETRNQLQGKKKNQQKTQTPGSYTIWYWTTNGMDHRRNQKGNRKIIRDKWQQRHNNPKPMGHNKSSSERELCSSTILSQERRKNWNKQPNFKP